MLSLKNYSITVEEKAIVKDLSYTFEDGKITAILGHNGSGKSSLALSLAGHPRYKTTGEATLNGHVLTGLNATERYNQGLFLSFQNIPEIPGIKVSEYLRTVYNENFKRQFPNEKPPSPFVFKRMVTKILPTLSLQESFLDRDLYVGFSGGEKRKIELLQIELLSPQVIILDEIDSGLDIDAIIVLREHVETWRTNGKTIIIISHNFHLLENIKVDKVLILRD